MCSRIRDLWAVHFLDRARRRVPKQEETATKLYRGPLLSPLFVFNQFGPQSINVISAFIAPHQVARVWYCSTCAVSIEPKWQVLVFGPTARFSFTYYSGACFPPLNRRKGIEIASLNFRLYSGTILVGYLTHVANRGSDIQTLNEGEGSYTLLCSLEARRTLLRLQVCLQV